MSTTIRPAADYVLVRGKPPSVVSSGGIIIPETARERSIFVEVVAVGPGRWLEEAGRRQAPELRPGDVAVLVRWGVNGFDLDGVEHLLIREDQILAVLI